MASYIYPNHHPNHHVLPPAIPRYAHPHTQCIHTKPKITIDKTLQHIASLQQESAATRRSVDQLVNELRKARDDINNLATCVNACWKAMQPHMLEVRKDVGILKDTTREERKSQESRDSVLNNQLQMQQQEQQVLRSEIQGQMTYLRSKLEQLSEPVLKSCPTGVSVKTSRVRKQARDTHKKAQSGGLRSKPEAIGLRRSSRICKPCQ